MIDQFFSIGSAAAAVSWALLILLPRWRGVAQVVAGLLVPALLSLAYFVLIAAWWSRGGGGFGSLEDVRTLFDTPPLLLAGWFHYLAFDLFVGAWIAHRAQADDIQHLLIVPILLLTFLFGPIGYLTFLGLRGAWRAGFAWPSQNVGPFAALHRLGFALSAREPILVATGLFFLLAMVPTGIAFAVDDRTLGGVDVWLKPLKFELSLALFAFTLAWFMPMASEAFRRSRAGRFVVWGFILPSVFEIAYIAFRASRAEASHFNVETPLAFLGYVLMGIGAVTLTAAAPVLAWGIARRDAPPAEPAYRLAVILGLVLTFALGGVAGIVMSTGTSHAVGIPAPGDTGIPIFGWLRSAGDLRVAHFLGVHAQQLVPMAGAALVLLLAKRARPAVWGFAVFYSVATIALFLQAMAGRPFLPL
jgi:hypothetical protein